jgi:segregation and condensation protein B
MSPDGNNDDTAGDGALASSSPPMPASSEADKMSVIEALLFVSPEPLSAGALSEITGFDPGAVREMINRLVESCAARDGGLVIREVAGGFGFYASPDAAPYIARLIRSQVNPRLTRAALETIAIVAYLQPVSRGVVAEIRGVPPGYAALFGTTQKFLERFGLKDLDALPPLEDFAPDSETIEKIKRSISWELEEDIGDTGGFEGGAGPETHREGRSRIEESGGEADPRGQSDPER